MKELDDITGAVVDVAVKMSVGLLINFGAVTLKEGLHRDLPPLT